MSLKVIGAGFGRTGTKSLQIALEQLGFAPCYHMTEVFKRPQDVDVWYPASCGEPVEWSRIFNEYQATVDWPGCTFYRELLQAYPHAKVVLSVRDAEKWYESAYATIYHLTQQPLIRTLGWLLPSLRRMTPMVFNIIWNGTFDGRFADKAHAIRVFNEHSEQVKQTVPAERLLVYSVKEGWEPLCAFLNVPVPATAFPHANDRQGFKTMIKETMQPEQQRVIRKTLGIIGGVGLLLLIARKLKY